MSKILKNFTPEQLYELTRDKLIADGVGLTNFNQGSRVRSILQAVASIASFIGFDMLEAIRQAIPIALYDGLNFTRKDATVATGFLRLFRLPIFTIEYTGADSDVQVTITATEITVTTSSTPADDFVVDFATFTTIEAVVAEIDSQTNYSSLQVGNGTVTNLFNYSNKQVVGTVNYLNQNNTLDIMVAGSGAVVISSGVQVVIDDITVQTTASSSIAAGDSTSTAIAATTLNTGSDQNIAVNAIDTLNGKGFIQTPVTGVEHAINDSAFANGEDEETDEERASRFQVYAQGLHGGTEFGLEARILELSGIKAVTVRSGHPVAGTNTIVADDGTGNLTVAKIDEIRKVIDGDPDDLINFPGAGVAGITYNIEPPIVVAVDVDATVFRIGTISDLAEITAAVQTAIEQYINTRRLGDDVVVAELIKRAKSAHPAVYDFVLTTPLINVSANLSEVTRTGSGTGASVTLTITTLPSIP